ncbi:hypothetical protein EV128_122139 [Rhizobium azibense]|nr:hypothetical protein EV128_122139 [Rhizobium azibense]
MFVVSLFEGEDERNFLATGLTFQGEHVFIDAAGVKHQFRRADIFEILPVYDTKACRDLPTRWCSWPQPCQVLPETATRQ